VKSEIARQIRECMSELEQTDADAVTARFRFPEDFIGFQGHFPRNPVLPAVCEIELALAVLEAWKTSGVILREIVFAKFSSPVTCDQEVVCSCSVRMEDGGAALVAASLTRDGATVAGFKLRVAFEDEERGRA
jgi:3-hydroxyacyl-[acyl-carrier-protein] dehydratase